MTATLSLPVDPEALRLYRDALKGAYEVDEEGEHTLVGAEFSLNQLLNFYSGYDESKLIPLGEGRGVFGDAPWFLYPDVVFSERDLIGALIDEIERLRSGGK